MENLKKTLSQMNGGKILDVGTGRGEFIYLLKDHLNSFTEMIGIDKTDRAITYCKEHFTDNNIHFIQMDAEQMSFADETFDTVCLSNSLHHIENQEATIKEMIRVLKPNGLLLINEMIRDVAHNEQLSHVKLHHFSAKIDNLLGICHLETYTKQEIIAFVNNLPLSDVKMIEYNFPNEFPKDMEAINYLVDMCDKSLERIRDRIEYEQYKTECEQLKEWIKKYGFNSATEVLVVGIK